MKNRWEFIWVILIALVVKAQGAITLLEKDDWKVQLGGFAQFDMSSDSTRSFAETEGSTPVARPGTINGDSGRTQFSVRNSRLAFTVFAPTQNGWKSKAHLEYDLLGAANGTAEGSFLGAPTLRMRHAYFSTETNGWQILAGQFWTLFGWQTYYLIPTVTVAPIPGETYLRTPQLLFMKNLGDLQAALSIVRPVQRDSKIPNLDGGIRYTFSGRKAGYVNSGMGEKSIQAMSIAITGTLREVETPINSSTTDQSHYTGYAGAVDFMIPLIASANDKDMSHSLVLSGEFTTGRGYGDIFTNWTGNLIQLPATGATSTQPNLDPGIGGFDSSGNFQLMKLQTFNVNLQYHFPSDWNTHMNIGYGQIYSNNVDGLSPLVANSSAYNRADVVVLNLFHDFTKQIRVGGEYGYFRTRYSDRIEAHNSRYQLTGWFRL
jgi:hypothetical protein